MSNLLCKLGVMSVKEEVVKEKPETVVNGNGHQNGCKNGKKEKDNVAIFDDDVACDKYLKALDPKDWKHQDHYRVLGLSVRRFDASESEIKKACMFVYLRTGIFLIIFRNNLILIFRRS